MNKVKEKYYFLVAKISHLLIKIFKFIGNVVMSLLVLTAVMLIYYYIAWIVFWFANRWR